jgi:hypothetical protein
MPAVQRIASRRLAENLHCHTSLWLAMCTALAVTVSHLAVLQHDASRAASP